MDFIVTFVFQCLARKANTDFLSCSSYRFVYFNVFCAKQILTLSRHLISISLFQRMARKANTDFQNTFYSDRCISTLVAQSKYLLIANISERFFFIFNVWRAKQVLQFSISYISVYFGAWCAKQTLTFSSDSIMFLAFDAGCACRAKQILFQQTCNKELCCNPTLGTQSKYSCIEAI